MATDTPNPTHDRTERCNECGRRTPHGVTIEIRTESDYSKNAKFSREPYRVATCRLCGTERVQRMNNAR